MRDDLMVQQQVNGAWQHMVAVICLNQTGRKKVKKILYWSVILNGYGITEKEKKQKRV